ncbi:hypothetical protein SAMN05216360_103112 [Methylobacterium phyllostachyos]|uniref:Ribbon-helix-helix protein, copG family n=1 Tax=Methylobacterium phyllostachyos TaxID=582672 RepID=A0A1G9V9H6_9HYPH|nr:hypothetical protein [Methylobacterium phyllostachyos]SDM68730.1 hypothetical protein SAMN05216360_103112 [Methylobacterium phyllostachyos]
MQTSDVQSSDTMEKVGVKPAMAVGHAPHAAPQSPPASGGSLPGALPRGPQPAAPDYRKLASKVDVRLTAPLRAALTAAAKAEGVTDGALIRRWVADALGLDAEADRASAPRVRIPPEEQAVLAGALRDLGALYEPLSRPSVPADEVKAGLDRIRSAVMPIVIGLGRSA